MISDLQLLRIALTFRWSARGDNSDPDDKLVLKSDVTELVAFKRMGWTDTSVSWEMETVVDLDDYGSDDDDAEESDYSDDVSEAEENDDDTNENGNGDDEQEGPECGE